MNDDPQILRTVILPDFTPEQVAYLDRLQAAARHSTFIERVGGADRTLQSRLRRG